MSHVRRAGFRSLRGFGWCVAVPVAIVVGVFVGFVFSSPTGFATGLGVSLFGLVLLSLGYSLGGIWESYWMVSVALVGGETNVRPRALRVADISFFGYNLIDI